MIGLEETTVQFLIEHTSAAVAIFDSEMRYMAASRRYIADHQLPGDALIGRSYYEVFPESAERWKEIHLRCLGGMVERGKEEPFRRKDGTLDWVSWETRPWRKDSGAIGGIVLFSEVVPARKQFEPEPAGRQRDLEAVIDNTDGSIWAVDTQYCLIAGNARYHHDVCAVLGRKLRKGESVLLPTFPPEALAEWRGYYDRALQGEQFSVEVATRFARPPRQVEYRVSPIRAEDGAITGATVFGHDVTEQRQLYAVARIIGSGVSTREAWRICLDAAQRVSGMDCGAISVFHTEEGAPEDGTLELVYASGLGDAFVQAVARLPRDDPHAQMVRTGKAHYFGVDDVKVMQLACDEGLRCMAVVPIRHRHEIIGVLNISSHVQTEIPGNVRQALETIAAEVGNFTVYQRAQRALRASEEKYRSLVEASDAAIVVVDDGGRIHYANTTAAPLADGTTADIIGKTMYEVESQAAADAYLAQAHAVMASNEGLTVEVLRGPAWYRSSVQPVRDASGNAVMALLSATDITELKRTQQELVELNRTLEARVAERTAEVRLAYHEIERAMRLKDEFLANMSHELRTPLNGILTLSEVILDGVYGDLPPRQERAMRLIDSSGRHLLALINDLLDLSKVEAGKLELELEAIEPDDACRASMLFVKDLADKKNIQLSYSNASTDGLPARVLADPRRLKQMLVNLLSNAVKFTQNGGRVHLEVLDAAGGQAIEFAVQDTGPGIAPEDQTRLFRPFVQLDASLAREHEGTGLGLALVKRLAEQHGGTVRVESEGIPGKGSRFTITLPRMAGDGDLAPQ